MSCVTNPTVKPLSMANAASLISLPALFTPKAPYPYVSISILSKPIKFQLSCSYFTLNSSSSLKKKDRFPAIVAFVASQELDEEEVEEEEEDAGESAGEEEYSEPSEDAKLFVANLSFDVDSEKLAELLQKAGTVEIAEVVYNRVTEKSRGFAFVTMSTVEEAEKAVDLFKGYEFYGRPLHIAKAAPSGTRLQSKQIYIGNLAWDVDDSRLEQIFSEYGKVVNVRVVCDKESGLSRGFGFVTMSTESEVHDAIANLDGETIGGRAIRVKMAKQRERRISS